MVRQFVTNYPEYNIDNLDALTYAGAINWYDFAVAIKEINGFTAKINSIDKEAFPTPAKRPHFSLLDKTKIKDTYKVQVPDCRISLEEMLANL